MSIITVDLSLVKNLLPVKQTQDMGELIVCLRHRMGLTQEQFAAQVGVTCPTVNRWENRKSRPSPIALRLIKSTLEELDGAEDLLTQYFPK